MLAAGPADERAPSLRIFDGFPGGSWVPTRDGAAQPGVCLERATLMLTGGHQPRLQCNFVIVSNTSDEAVITYRCPSGLSGHTRARRETRNLYSVTAQGIFDNAPFFHRTEWRFAGRCQPGERTKIDSPAPDAGRRR